MKEIVSSVKAKSHFQIFTRKGEAGELVAKTGKCFNQITDYGYRQIYIPNQASITVFPSNASNYQRMRFLKLSTSTEEVVPEDTSLSAIIATNDGNSGAKPAAPTIGTVVDNGIRYVKLEQWFVFPLGVLSNVTFTKLGIYSANNETTLICGQLIKDGLGNPTAITVLSDEQLLVKYTSYWPAIDNSLELGSFAVGASTATFRVTGSATNQVFFGEANGSNIRGLWSSSTAAINSLSGNNGAAYSTNLTNYANRVEIIINVNAGLLDYTAPIDYLSFLGHPTQGGGIRPFRLDFSPSLPKTDQNVLNLSFRWTLKWREE